MQPPLPSARPMPPGPALPPAAACPRRSRRTQRPRPWRLQQGRAHRARAGLRRTPAVATRKPRGNHQRLKPGKNQNPARKEFVVVLVQPGSNPEFGADWGFRNVPEVGGYHLGLFWEQVGEKGKGRLLGEMPSSQIANVATRVHIKENVDRLHRTGSKEMAARWQRKIRLGGRFTGSGSEGRLCL